MLLESIRVDDVVGAIPAHLACGIWGTMAVPLTNGDVTFGAQAIGVVAIGAFVFIVSAIVWTVLKMTIGIRMSEEDEHAGGDYAELGMEAYPEWGQGSQKV